MKKINWHYGLLALAGITLWVIENIYFGWNKTPQSGLEGFCDLLAAILMFWGVVGDITSNLTIVKRTDIEHVESIKIFTPKMENRSDER